MTVKHFAIDSKRPAARYTLTLLVLLFSLFAQSAIAAPLSVYVSVLPQKYMVERIGGGQVQAHVLVGPGQNPATYEPSPRQMVGMGKAILYFRIGVPFEDIWMDRLAANLPNMTIVHLLDGIPVQTIEQHHHDHRGMEEEEGLNVLDPHAWTNPLHVISMGKTIRDTLINKDPAHADDYKRNYEAFRSDLIELDQEIRQHLAPLNNRKFMVFHPSWGYFAQQYGLQQVSIEIEGKEPGAKALANLISKARQEGIRTIFVQPQFNQKLARTIARAIDGKVLAIDPLAEDYINNMRIVAHTLAVSL